MLATGGIRCSAAEEREMDPKEAFYSAPGHGIGPQTHAPKALVRSTAG